MDDIGSLAQRASAPDGLAKFEDPRITAKGEARAHVALERLETLWFNTGTLCNIACTHCYIESSPKNDRLAYLSLGDVRAFLDEIAAARLETRLIGFTGGEPFMNPAFLAMLRETLGRGHQTLVLTNAMRPMQRVKIKEGLVALRKRYGSLLRLRVSLDDPRAEVHDAERGAGAYAATLVGLSWLIDNGFAVEIAGRGFAGEPQAGLRARFAALFAEIGLGLDAHDPSALVIFPEMDPFADPPEITEACWGILGKSPAEVMCASARMVVRRRGAEKPAVLACTLLPYDAQFELGASLAEASEPVALNHSYCASFCVLGGASCGTAKG